MGTWTSLLPTILTKHYDTMRLKKTYLVIAFVILELLIVMTYLAFATAIVVNRGDDGFARLGMSILLVGFLVNFVPLILVFVNKIAIKTGLYVLLIATIFTCVFSFFGGSLIYNLKIGAKTASYNNIRNNTQITVLSDKAIIKHGLPVGIRVELKVSLPEKNVFTSRMSVPGYTDEYKRYDKLMRMLACGDLKPFARCHFLNSANTDGLTQAFEALDEKDYKSPFWPSNFDNRKVRQIYFELVPASGQSVRRMKGHGTYRVSTELLSGKLKRLPLRLWLNGRVKDNELATFDLQTINSYNLREMFKNSGRKEVLKEILMPLP